MLYYNKFWEHFATILGKLELPNVDFFDTALYLKLRLKYFFIDRYLLSDPVTPASLKCSNLDSFDGLKNLTQELKTYLLDNLCIVLSSSESISQTLNELEGEIDFLVNSDGVVLDQYLDQFKAIFATFLANPQKKLIEYIIEIKSFKLLSRIDLT